MKQNAAELCEDAWFGGLLISPLQLQSDNKISEPFCFRKKPPKNQNPSSHIWGFFGAYKPRDWTTGIKKAGLKPVLKGIELVKTPVSPCHLHQPAGLSRRVRSAKQLPGCRDRSRGGSVLLTLSEPCVWPRMRTLLKRVYPRLLGDPSGTLGLSGVTKCCQGICHVF